MTESRNLLDTATTYHRNLPDRIRQYLNGRGISDEQIDVHLLGWNGRRITIPIFNYAGTCAFFKLAKDPEDKSGSPKMLATPGAYAELYGWEQIRRQPQNIIVCEGEFDRLVLERKGFAAVTSTGGAGTFRFAWAVEFATIPHVYLCFDRDEAGRNGALRVGRMIPHARLVELPLEVGDSGDVTDFFVRLRKSRKEFLQLLKEAQPVPPEQSSPLGSASRSRPPDPALQQRITQIKADLPIAAVIGRYLKLLPSGQTFTGLCPFHADRRPSLTVYPVTGTFYCFGCLKHGDVINFLQEIERLSFNQTLDALDHLRGHHE